MRATRGCFWRWVISFQGQKNRGRGYGQAYECYFPWRWKLFSSYFGVTRQAGVPSSKLRLLWEVGLMYHFMSPLTASASSDEPSDQTQQRHRTLRYPLNSICIPVSCLPSYFDFPYLFSYCSSRAISNITFAIKSVPNLCLPRANGWLQDHGF